eukprot:1665437-Alexandrium_andersonii.AAC.1
MCIRDRQSDYHRAALLDFYMSSACLRLRSTGYGLSPQNSAATRRRLANGATGNAREQRMQS